MAEGMQSHWEWCVVRNSMGRLTRARAGYKSQRNAAKAIPSVAKEWAEREPDKYATYCVGRYLAGSVAMVSVFRTAG